MAGGFFDSDGAFWPSDTDEISGPHGETQTVRLREAGIPRSTLENERVMGRPLLAEARRIRRLHAVALQGSRPAKSEYAAAQKLFDYRVARRK